MRCRKCYKQPHECECIKDEIDVMIGLPLEFVKELAHIGWTANSKLESQISRNKDLPYAYKAICNIHLELLEKLNNYIKEGK